MNTPSSRWSEGFAGVAIAAAVAAAILFVAAQNFLFFHTTAELFAVAVAFGVFFIAWNTRRIAANGFFLSLGVLYLYVGVIDLLHTVAFKGLGVLDGGSANLATQLWLAARLLESVGLLASLMLVRRQASGELLHAVYGGGTAVVLASMFWLGIFPDAYVEGVGLTDFKIYSEYLVVLLLLAALLVLVARREAFSRRSFSILLAMFAFKILAELVFTTYAEVTEFAVQVGHLLKICSFYLAYLATIKAVLADPYELLFHDLEATRESLAQSEERFRQAISPAPVAVFSLDRELRFTWLYNPQILSLRPDAVGRSLQEVYQGQDGERLGSLCRRVIEVGIGVRQRVRLEHGDGGNFEVTLEPLRGHGIRAVTGIIGTAIDVTELMEARAEAERANEAKSRFLAAASHDLRQPFQAMRLFHHLLDQQLADVRQREISRKLSEAMSGGEGLLNSLLDISTLEAGRITPSISEVPVREVLAQVTGELEPQATAKGLSLRVVPCSAVVRSDPVLLTRMVRNLLTNAVRYTRDGRVLVGCRRSGSHLRIEVWDTGPGIPADKLDAIFEDFYRLESGREGDGRGLGLGLSIVSRLARLLQHRASVRSWPGRGSVFSIEVSLAGYSGVDDGVILPHPTKVAAP